MIATKTSNEGLVLRNSVVVRVDRRQKTVTFYSSKVMRLRFSSSRLLEAIDRLRTGTSASELADILGSVSANTLMTGLEEHQLVRRTFVNDYAGGVVEHQVALLSNFVDDPNAAQQRLSNAHVALVGCGGTGMVALQHLVGAGVREFTLIDPDRVSLSNLNRQFVPSAIDVGRRKVEVCAEYVRERVTDPRIHSRCDRIGDLEDLQRCLTRRPEIVVCCADSPPTMIRSIVTAYALAAKTACIFGGVAVAVGNVGPLLAEDQSKQSYLSYLDERLKSAVEEPPVVAASIGPTNSIVAAFMSLEIIRFLVGIEPVRTLRTALEISFDDLTTRVLRAW